MPSQAHAVLALVGDLLGPAMLGLYLHGSSVVGGPRRDSDLDLLAVTDRTLDRAERAALVAGLLPMSDRALRGPDGRPIELVSVVRGDVVPWRYPPTMDFLYGEWLRRDYLAGMVPGREVSPDVATLLTIVRAAGRAIAGPPPAELLDRVPPDDLRRAVVAGLPALRDELADDTRNVLLTLARAWVTLATGEIRPKDGAADWALERLAPEHRPVLAHARAAYRDEADERWEGRLAAGIPGCADAMLAEIRRHAADAR